jgi:hypothetical protein
MTVLSGCASSSLVAITPTLVRTQSSTQPQQPLLKTVCPRALTVHEPLTETMPWPPLDHCSTTDLEISDHHLLLLPLHVHNTPHAHTPRTSIFSLLTRSRYLVQNCCRTHSVRTCVRCTRLRDEGRHVWSMTGSCCTSCGAASQR